jgi:predicted XRE-type DNA-binding protein
MHLNKEQQERFWAKVAIGSPDECWLWTAGRRNGYGQFGTNTWSAYAHRISWVLYNGQDIPEGMYVCHRCDVRLCVNPHHLFLGTPKDNIRDMLNKGRGAKGEQSGQSKLTSEQVQEIRRLWREGVNQKVIAKKFRITQAAVSDIITGKNWKHLPNPYQTTDNEPKQG